MRIHSDEISLAPATETWLRVVRRLLQEQHQPIADQQGQPIISYVMNTEASIDFERPEHWEGLVQDRMRPPLQPDNDSQVQVLLAEVDAVEAEALEEGFPCPSEQARSNAKQLLEGIART